MKIENKHSPRQTLPGALAIARTVAIAIAIAPAIARTVAIAIARTS